MRLSEKQAIILFDIAKWSLGIVGVVGGIDEKTRVRIVNEIVNQQSDALVDLDRELVSK